MDRTVWSRLGSLLVIPLYLLISCGQDLVLEGEDGGIHLSYDCTSFQPVAASTSEHSLIRDNAIRIVAWANAEGRIDEVRSLMDADAEGDRELVERMVVEMLCRDPSILESAAVAAVSGRDQTGAALDQGPQLAPGNPAPNFQLPVLNQAYFDGRPTHVRLSDLRGRYVFLTFWATTCSPCLAELYELQPIWEELAPRGVHFFGIVQKGDEVQADRWLKVNTPHIYPSLVDSIMRVMTAYHVRGIPSSFLIGPSGDVAKVWKGWGPDAGEQFSRAMAGLLEESTR